MSEWDYSAISTLNSTLRDIVTELNGIKTEQGIINNEAYKLRTMEFVRTKLLLEKEYKAGRIDITEYTTLKNTLEGVRY